MAEERAKLRIDKWLWQARFFKTRSLAAKQVTAGHVRLNGQRALKPAQAVGPEDVLTFPQGQIVRVIRVEKLGDRRGPAPEAQTLYRDLSPPVAKAREAVVAHPEKARAGRPNRQERAALARFKRGDEEL